MKTRDTDVAFAPMKNDKILRRRMMTIHITRDYDLFNKHISNREVLQGDLTGLMESMEKRNLLQCKPILVDSSMRVIDGQHRLEVARRLGLDVYYTIGDALEEHDIILLNAHQKNWNLKNYLHFFVSLRKDAYIKMEEFLKKHELVLTDGLNIFFSRVDYKTFKTGKFEFPTGEALYKAETIIQRHKEIIHMISFTRIEGEKICKRASFISALYEFLKIKNMSYKTLFEKLRLKISNLYTCGSSVEAYRMIKEIYNWKNNKPILSKK